MPIVLCLFNLKANFSFVPTPSVQPTNTQSLFLYSFGSLNKPLNPPIPEITSFLYVFFASGFIYSTVLFPLSISTPASLYVSFVAIL